MKMLKKLTAMLLIGVMVLSLAACGSSSEDKTDETANSGETTTSEGDTTTKTETSDGDTPLILDACPNDLG